MNMVSTGRRVIVAIALLAAAATLVVPNAASAGGAIRTLSFCTGDGWVTAYRYGEPGLDEVSSFSMHGTVGCVDGSGAGGYEVLFSTRTGRIEGEGWCADPDPEVYGTPGNITMSAILELQIRRPAERTRWYVVRKLSGRSTAPVPTAEAVIKGQVRTPPDGLQVGRFRIEPMGSWNDCYSSFMTVRFYNLLIGPSPGT